MLDVSQGSEANSEFSPLSTTKATGDLVETTKNLDQHTLEPPPVATNRSTPTLGSSNSYPTLRPVPDPFSATTNRDRHPIHPPATTCPTPCHTTNQLISHQTMAQAQRDETLNQAVATIAASMSTIQTEVQQLGQNFSDLGQELRSEVQQISQDMTTLSTNVDQ